VLIFVTAGAQGNQVQIVIVALLAAELLVVDLHRSVDWILRGEED
jgi:hypothetical protein